MTAELLERSLDYLDYLDRLTAPALTVRTAHH